MEARVAVLACVDSWIAMDDDWRIDNGLTSLRARIYALLPAD
jgi:hypothetical protein